MGADALSEALSELKEGSLEWHAQDEREVTFAPKVTKQEMKLAPEDSAQVKCVEGSGLVLIPLLLACLLEEGLFALCPLR